MTNDPNQEISKQVKPVFRPDCQDDLIKFIDDPETINKAAEGSMDKQRSVTLKANINQVAHRSAGGTLWG